MFNRLKFTKMWTVSDDTEYFPTVETSEEQVREDMQWLFNEIRDYLNDVLLPALEASNGAANTGAVDNTGKATTVQAFLNALDAEKHTHSNKVLLDTYTHSNENIGDVIAKVHTHGNKSVIDSITAVTTTLGSSSTSVPSEQAVNDALVGITLGQLPDKAISTENLNVPGDALNGQVLTATSDAAGGFAWMSPPEEGLILVDGGVFQNSKDVATEMRQALDVPEDGLIMQPDGRVYQAGVDKTTALVNSLGVVGGVFHLGNTAPSDTRLLWIDTTDVTGGLKYYNGSAWDHVPVAYAP